MFQYPFAAVVGMERAKRSLLLHAVDPRIGGCLLMGHRGCAKSTLARGFAALLPEADGQPAPFVEVPLGVSEDRLLGSVHAEALVRSGAWTPQPGLIEASHRGVLYLDEINLLPDALADLLLDSAASGVHRLERDGLSRSLPARYVLVGSMNPEEGELRPQLSDRFAHGVRVEDRFSAAERVEIGRRRMAFEDDPEAFLAGWAEETGRLRNALESARSLLLRVEVPEAMRLALAERARTAGLEGMRAELAVLRTARASAALRGEETVAAADVDEAWELCVGHRLSESAAGGSPPDRPPNVSSSSSATRPSQHQSASGAAQSKPTPSMSQPSAASQQLSASPTDALPEPVLLRPMVKPRLIALPLPERPVRTLTAQMRSDARATACLSTARLQTGPVRWHASVIASWKNAWRPGGAGWRTVREQARPVRALWALLDASRSGGASQFLAGAREALASLLRAPMRANLLVVHDGAVRWVLRRGTPAAARRVLASIPDARGKSPLTVALRAFHRGVANAGASPSSVACICSDGFPSLEPGQTAAAARRGMQHTLQRLGRSVRGPFVWVGPAAVRAFGDWLERLVQGSGARVVRLEPSPLGQTI